MRKVLVAAFVLLAVASILYAQERIRVRTDIQKKFDRNRNGWLEPHEQEALEKFMRGREKKGNPDEIEQLKRRIHELLGAAEEAEADGNMRKAENLRRQAEELKRKFKGAHPEKPGPKERHLSPEEAENMKREIEKLLDRAEQAEREGRFREALALVEKAEALEKELSRLLERGLKGEPERSEPPFPPEIMKKIEQAKRHIEELHRMAAQAKEEGNMDRANELLEKAQNIERQVHEFIEQFEREHRPDEGERPPHREEMEWVEKAKHEIEKLREAAREAREQGHNDRAEALWREAEALERKLKEAMAKRSHREKPGPHPEMEEKIAGMKREIEHLRDMANEAKERGQHDKAEDLWREAEKLEAALKEMIERLHRPPEGPAPEEVEKLRRELGKLVELAKRAEEAGNERKARELYQKAEEIERRLREMTGHRERPGEGGGIRERLEEVRHEREKITRELDELRKHLEELGRIEEELMRELKKRKK